MKLIKWIFTFYRFFILGKKRVYLIAAVVIVWLAITQLQTRGPSLAAVHLHCILSSVGTKQL